MPNPITLEVCVASLTDALAATQGGADRLELNVALELGGLTPTAGLLQEVKQAVAVPVLVMIRPRAAGFHYHASELRLMLQDAETLLNLGADGLVSGALSHNATLDRTFWKSLVRLAGDRETVFHRAFDTVPAPERLLTELIELETTRVLTSGGQATAPDGIEQIARLRDRSAGSIELLPGSGVTRENVVEIIRRTGCDQVHGSFSYPRHDDGGPVVDGAYPATDQQRVADARRALDTLA